MLLVIDLGVLWEEKGYIFILMENLVLKCYFIFVLICFFGYLVFFMMLDDNMLGIIKMFDVLIKLDKFV